MGEETGDGVAEGLVDAPLPVGVHVQVHDHDPAGSKMLFDQGEELSGRHLEGDGDVLVGIHLDHVVLPLDGLEIGAAVIGGHVHGLREGKIGLGQVRDLVVDLYATDLASWEIAGALGGEGPGAVAQDEDASGVGLVEACHHGGSQGVVVVHSGQVI